MDAKYPDPLRPHAHEPNPRPPGEDSTIELLTPDEESIFVHEADLRRLSQHSVQNCYIVSTGHGTSGPLTFDGVRLLDLVQMHWKRSFDEVEVVSADGFGNRIFAAELHQADPAGPILLALDLDGQPLSRQEGLVRMIVPSERDDALRQVKWVGRIRIV